MEIKKTYNYKLFKFYNENRTVKTHDLRKVINSIEEIGLKKSHHIIVDKNFFIVDGQHRFLACMQLGLPIYYVIDNSLTITDVARMNKTTTSWKNTDYIHHFSSLGNKDYVELERCIKLYPSVNHRIIRMAMEGTYNNYDERIKAGTFKITVDRKIYLYEIEKIAKVLSLFSKNSASRSFGIACLWYSRHGVDINDIYKAYVVIISNPKFEQYHYLPSSCEHAITNINFVLNFRKKTKTDYVSLFNSEKGRC